METTVKKRNRNAIRSVNMLMDAYIKLLMYMPAEKITVTAIVNEAGLNRSTFYAHFGCPNDVYRKLETRLVEELLERINGLSLEGLIQNPKPMLETVTRLIEERRDYVKLMFEKHKAEHWMESLKEAVIDKFMSDKYTAQLYADREMLMVNLRFFVGGYISLCRDYISNKIEKPLSEMTDTLATTIAVGLAAGIRKN